MSPFSCFSFKKDFYLFIPMLYVNPFWPYLSLRISILKKIPSKISEDTFTQVSVLMTKWFRRKGIFIDVSLFIPIVKCQPIIVDPLYPGTMIWANLKQHYMCMTFEKIFLYLNLHKNSSPIESHPTPWDNDFTKLLSTYPFI